MPRLFSEYIGYFSTHYENRSGILPDQELKSIIFQFYKIVFPYISKYIKGLLVLQIEF